MKLLTHTCDIKRRVKVGAGLSSRWETIKTGVKCLVLPATPNNTLNPNLIVGKDYNAYFEASTDVREGDKLVVSTGLIVLVKGIASYVGVPNVSHIEASCETEGV